MEPEKLIDVAIRLTRESISHAENGDWEQLEVNEQKRQAMITDLNALEVDESLLNKVHQQMRLLIQLNDDLSAICLSERNKAALQIKQITQGKKANSAYTD